MLFLAHSAFTFFHLSQNVESYMACGVPWSCCLPEFYRNRHCGLGLRNTPTDPALELRQEIRRERNEMDLKHFIHTKGCMEQVSFESFAISRIFWLFAWIYTVIGFKNTVLIFLDHLYTTPFHLRKSIPAKSYIWVYSRSIDENTEKTQKFARKKENLAKISFDCKSFYL